MSIVLLTAVYCQIACESIDLPGPMGFTAWDAMTVQMASDASDCENATWPSWAARTE